MFRSLFFTLLLSWVSSKPKESIHITEDLPIGASIYTFSTVGCKTVTNAGTYRFVDSQKNSNDLFLIDPYTGRVTTKKLIDRDEFCLRRLCSCSQCEIILEVLCVKVGEIFFDDLSIIIDDQNDHSPQFPKSSLTIDVLENVPIGYLIPIDTASDLDYGHNSIQGYTLLEENSTNRIVNAFQIEYSKKSDLLALRLMKALDRELYHSLEYVIQAHDGGQPQALFGRLNIHLNILDVNDMSPVFDRSDIHVLLSESTTNGSLVARVHAYDGDSGLNGLVYYTIVSLDPPSNGTFLLSKETGEVRLGKRLDYEKEKSYRMKVKAQDNGPQQGSLPAFAMIHIEIKDENDNYPLITSTFNDDHISGVEHSLNSSLIRIRENLPNGTFLGHISISDLDQGNNGRVSWSLESHGSISIKELLNNEAFLMFTSRPFDREEHSQYDVFLKAYDHGIPLLSSTLNLTLLIIDENDNAPKFDKEIYRIRIAETTPRNTLLLRFNATDDDEENTMNSEIEYQLSNQTVFSLNSTSGELYLIGTLDREEKASYELQITTFDHGQSHRLSSTVRCIIDLIDINDNYPIFDFSEYLFQIPETWSHRSPIGHVHARDADEYYGELSYTLASNETTMIEQWPFELTSNGTLYLKQTSAGIDYEQRSNYQCLIVASDNDGLNSSVPVTISILNRNDFCPELLHNTTVLFFNTDLWWNSSGENSSNRYPLEVFDGDNDTCLMELVNFNHIFQIQSLERNHFLLYAHTLPDLEYYILQFHLRDLVNETIDQSCLQTIQLVLTIGNNETNQTVALDTARDYFEAIRSISQRSHSYFDLTILNVILLFVLFSIAMLIALISLKLISFSSKSYHRRDTHTLYRLQGHTDTQLPLLDHELGEQSLASSSTNQFIEHENDEQQQQLLCQLKSKAFQTYALQTHTNTYDMIGDILHSGAFSFSSYAPHFRDSGCEITLANFGQQSLNSPASPTSVAGQSSIDSDTKRISRALKTFSSLPPINQSGNDLSTTLNARLAEQEVIEV